MGLSTHGPPMLGRLIKARTLLVFPYIGSTMSAEDRTFIHLIVIGPIHTPNGRTSGYLFGLRLPSGYRYRVIGGLKKVDCRSRISPGSIQLDI